MSTFHRMGENVVFQLVYPPIANIVDGTYPATYIDVTNFERFGFILQVGATDDTAVTMQLVQATSAAAAGSKNITGAAITGTLLAGTNDNKWAEVEVEQRKLDLPNDFRYVAATIGATGGSATLASLLFFGFRARTYPVTQGSDNAELVYVDG